MEPSRPRTVPLGRLTLVLLIGSLVAVPACERRQGRARELSFEQLTDTTGLTRGAPLLTSLEPYRITGAAIRVRGTVTLPEGTRLQVSIVRVSTGETVTSAQAVVDGGGFETPPLMSPRGPFPVDLYRFEVSSQFNSSWQPEEVLRATQDGHSLRGPGMTRGSAGQAGFFLSQERRL